MKIGVVGDVHWSKYSSIVRSRGNKYSTRLENCINSVSWAERTLEENDCDLVVYLGDFFDSSDLKSEELSALNEIRWNSLKHIFLVGNHEMGLNDLSISSCHLFNLLDNIEVIDKPGFSEQYKDLFFLPYILEENRKSVKEYLKGKTDCIIFSHNDLKGIQLGKFVSQTGFELDEIENSCNLFINGHIHNGMNISSKIINLGNLTGQNFSEDATKYGHRIMIIDTDTLECEYFVNPFAFNFFKFDLTTDTTYNEMIKVLWTSNNPVFTVKAFASDDLDFSDIFTIVAHRTIIQPIVTHSESNEKAYESLSVNHLEKFKEYILNELGNSNDVLEELSAVVQ